MSIKISETGISVKLEHTKSGVEIVFVNSIEEAFEVTNRPIEVEIVPKSTIATTIKEYFST